MDEQHVDSTKLPNLSAPRIPSSVTGEKFIAQKKWLKAWAIFLASTTILCRLYVCDGPHSGQSCGPSKQDLVSISSRLESKSTLSMTPRGLLQTYGANFCLPALTSTATQASNLP